MEDIVLFKTNKKRKNEEEKPVEQVNESNGEHKKKKKHKKESNGHTNGHEVSEADPQPDQSNGEKKKKKKHKKKDQDQIIEEQPQPEVEENHTEVSEKKKKKKKKEKQNGISEHQNTEEEQPQSNGSSKKHKKNESNGFQDYYEEHSELANLAASEVNEFRSSSNISVSYLDNSNPSDVIESEPHLYTDKKENLPDFFKDLKPILKFHQLVLPNKKLLDITKGFNKPTSIQSQCWPFLLSGKDLIGIAETGSGKTLSFGIPAMVHLLRQKTKSQGPRVLILSPTRELAIQTFEVLENAGKLCNISAACFYGGVSKDSQYAALKKGVDILVATPGRLLDLMNEGVVSLQNVSYLVLDEADRMLDKGFERDIKTILSKTPSERQTVMFSATWPQSIRNLAVTFLKCPIRVTIGTAELAANHKVTQIVEVIENERDKDFRLLKLLEDYHKSRKNRILIFILYKKEAPRVENLLSRKGYKVAAIHGDMTQAQRITAFNGFKDGTTPLLVATDVAARGLDIPDVEYVINYSFPLTIEDYVHRIGRTGRAGKTGTAYTMFGTQDKIRAAELCGILNEAGAEIPDQLRKLASYGTKKQEHALYGHHVKDLGNKPMPKKLHMKFDDDE